MQYIKYIKYILNTGEYLNTEDFESDWDPIGATIIRRMEKNNLIEIDYETGKMKVTYKGYAYLHMPEAEDWIVLDSGKYIIGRKEGSMKAFRYGEEWRDCTGDNLIFHLVHALLEVNDE